MKKLISTLTALTLALSSMAALSSNATYFAPDSRSEYYKWFIENTIPIDKETLDFLPWINSSLYEGCDKFYYHENSKELTGVKQLSSRTVVTFTDSDARQEANIILQDYYDEGKIDIHCTVYSYVLHENEWYIAEVTPNKNKDISLADAKKVCKILKEKNLITDFVYVDRYQMIETAWAAPTYYSIAGEDETVSLIQNYVEENLPNWQVKVDESSDSNIGLSVVPNENATADEYFAVAKQLYEDLEILPLFYGTRASTSDETGDGIDMYNAVLGDANCDGSVNIADSTFILQCLTNADEYGLSEQGRYNADVCGNFDGVTAEDALEIQRLDANVIDDFE